MKEVNNEMVAVFGANVTELGGEVQVHSDDVGHARRSLIENKGFENDWFKVYIQ
jgi:hypothetical protein